MGLDSSSKGTTQNYIPGIQDGERWKYAGIEHYSTLADLNAVLALERANIASGNGLWRTGQRFSVGVEPGYRIATIATGGGSAAANAAASHASTVILPNGSPVLMLADSNTITATAAAPSGGSNGDRLYNYAQQLLYTRTSGAWDDGVYVGVPLMWDAATVFAAGSLPAEVSLLAAYASVISGTPNRVIVNTPAANSIVLDGPQDLGTVSDVQHRDMLLRHLKGSGAAPTVAYGTGAGSNATPTAATFAGSDLLSTLSITPSATPAATSVVTAVTFSAAFAAAPTVLLIPTNNAARTLMASGGSPTVAPGNVTTAGFSLTSGSALAAGTAYTFAFLVLG